MINEQELDTFGASEEDDSANAESANTGEEYRLSPERLTRNKNRMERRAMKNRLGDRRSSVRLNADGTPQPDRRLANRIANAANG